MAGARPPPRAAWSTGFLAARAELPVFAFRSTGRSAHRLLAADAAAVPEPLGADAAALAAHFAAGGACPACGRAPCQSVATVAPASACLICEAGLGWPAAAHCRNCGFKAVPRRRPCGCAGHYGVVAAAASPAAPDGVLREGDFVDVGGGNAALTAGTRAALLAKQAAVPTYVVEYVVFVGTALLRDGAIVWSRRTRAARWVKDAATGDHALARSLSSSRASCWRGPGAPFDGVVTWVRAALPEGRRAARWVRDIDAEPPPPADWDIAVANHVMMYLVSRGPDLDAWIGRYSAAARAAASFHANARCPMILAVRANALGGVHAAAIGAQRAEAIAGGASAVLRACGCHASLLAPAVTTECSDGCGLRLPLAPARWHTPLLPDDVLCRIDAFLVGARGKEAAARPTHEGEGTATEEEVEAAVDRLARYATIYPGKV